MELSIKNHSVNHRYAGRNEPLAAVHEEQWTQDLDENKGGEEVSYPPDGARHHSPTVAELPGLMEPLVAAQCLILEEAKSGPDDSACDQGGQ